MVTNLKVSDHKQIMLMAEGNYYEGKFKKNYSFGHIPLYQKIANRVPR